MRRHITRREFLNRAAMTAAVTVPAAALLRGDRAFARGAGRGAALDTAAANRLIQAFMTKYSVPGMSIAMAKDAKMIHTQGFGVAARSTAERVTPDHLFRIASVSKPFTSATIFSLIEQGKLRLGDRIFGRDAILGVEFGAPPYKQPRVADITLEHLLTHTAGGWQNDGSDPMFSHPRMDHRELITWTIANQPLVNAPGSHYAYSNFGYCVAGRVIEKITGKPYGTAVRELILQRCGITTMRIAGNTLAERAPHEVVYYGQGNENPYGMQVARMDSHGGWLATPTDLVRFLLRVDGFATEADILTAASIATMTTASAANAGYAKGWAVNAAHNWWHNGSLPGTMTIMVRTSDGYCWAALTNTRSTSSTMGGDLDRLMWDVRAALAGG